MPQEGPGEGGVRLSGPPTEVVHCPCVPSPPRVKVPWRSGWGWWAECSFSRRVQGRGQESPRDGLADFPRSLSHQSQNLDLTLDSGVKAASLGPSPSQVENLQALWKQSQPEGADRRERWSSSGQDSGQAPWGLGDNAGCAGLANPSLPQMLAEHNFVTPPTHLSPRVHSLVGGGTHGFAPGVLWGTRTWLLGERGCKGRLCLLKHSSVLAWRTDCRANPGREAQNVQARGDRTRGQGRRGAERPILEPCTSHGGGLG